MEDAAYIFCEILLKMLCFRPQGHDTYSIKHGGQHFSCSFLSVYMLKTNVSTVTYMQSLYPGPISTWSLHQSWNSAKTSFSTALMKMEPGLHTSGSKVESHWAMWRGSCCRLTRSSWPSHGWWWQMMTSTAVQWRILWGIWQACLSDWLSTVSDTVFIMCGSASKMKDTPLLK